MQTLERTNKANASLTASDILPDFCNSQVILAVVLIAQLSAIVLTLSHDASWYSLFSRLGYTSIFIQSIALIDAAVLCYGKRWLVRLSPIVMAVVIYILMQLITVVMTLLGNLILALAEPDWQTYRADWWHAMLRNVCISAIITGGMLRYFYVRHQNNLRQQAENEARVQALQARIRPHFLFNCLNTIANLIHTQPNQAESAVLDLAELFRSTLSGLARISLAEEIDISRRYLNMEQLRLGERLQVQWHIPEELNQLQLPALVLQPLVENAVYHGIEPLATGGVIQIVARRVDTDMVELCVSNPLADSGRRLQSRGNQLAVENIRQRLLLAYDQVASLRVTQEQGNYTVILTLPWQTDIPTTLTQATL